MKGEIINRVEKSLIETLDIKFFRGVEKLVLFDIKDYLHNDFVLREKEFRKSIENLDLNFYSNKFVALNCSNDAIVPSWAYMLLISKLENCVNKVVVGNLEYLEKSIYIDNINSFDFSIYRHKKVVIKGCSDLVYVNSIYAEIMKKLLPFADRIMYGEPCSKVPIYKRQNKQ